MDGNLITAIFMLTLAIAILGYRAVQAYKFSKMEKKARKLNRLIEKRNRELGVK